MNKKSKSFATVLAVAVALIAGLAIGHQLTPPKEQVRAALYQACVNGHSYEPTSDNSRNPFACNRRSIDFTMATIYGDSYMEPLPDAETRAKYEDALTKFKRR